MVIGRLVGGPGLLLLHGCRIVLEKRNDVTACMKIFGIESSSDGLVEAGFGLIEAIQSEVSEKQIAVNEGAIRVEALSNDQFGEGFVWLAELDVESAEIDVRDDVARVGVLPELIDLDRAIEIASDVFIIMRGYIEFFPFAGSFLPIERLFRVFHGKPVLTDVGILLAQNCISHGEIGVELNGILEVRNRFRLHAPIARR